MATQIYGNGTSTATNGSNVQTFYFDKAGIKAANASSIYGQFCDRKSMPQNMGKTFKISRWQHLYDLDLNDAAFAAKGYLGKRDLTTISDKLNATDGSGAALTEGAGAINQVSPQRINYETSLARYGFMIEYTDEVKLFSDQMVQVRYREELGYLINQTEEDLIQRDMLNSAGITINAGDVTIDQMGTGILADGTGDELFKVSYDLIRKGVKALKRNRAKKVTEVVTGSTKIDTRTVNSAYYAIVGPEVKFDLENVTRGTSYESEFTFVPAFKYASAGNLAEGEFGQMHDVRFIESEGALMEEGAGAAIPVDYEGELSNDGSNFNVYPILFPTQGAFAAVGLRGKNRVQFNAVSPETVNQTNPYGTKGFFSANFFYASLALMPEKILRINVLASA